MCNLYSITTNQAAIAHLFRVVNRYVGNLPPMPGVFPDYPAPIARNGADGRELAMARWGMPSSQFALMQATKKRAAKLEAKGKPVDFKELVRMEPDGGITNIRKQANEQPEHWHIHYASVRVGLIQQRSGHRRRQWREDAAYHAAKYARWDRMGERRI